MSSLTCAQWVVRLANAEAALEKVALGQNATMTRYGEKQVQFTPATMKDLMAWRDECQRAVDACNGVTPTSGRSIIHVTPFDG